MAYVTTQDYIDMFGQAELEQLTDKTLPVDAVDADVWGIHLAGVESFIDSRLSGIYIIPLTVINGEIKKIILDLVRASLFVNNETEEVTSNQKLSLKAFEAYYEGGARIAGAATITNANVGAVAKTPAAVFTEDLFKLQ
jgi:phage gp36-like protein